VADPGGTGRWVYGVVPGEALGPEGHPGVDGSSPVQLERCAGLAAVTSDVPLDEFGTEPLMAALEDLGRVEELARAHERVVEQAREAAGTVVPFRLCTIYTGPEQVREMLERERETLADALERLRGRAEWGVKAYVVPREAPAAGDGDGDANGGGGAAYLKRKAAARDAADAAWEAVALAAHAVHERLAAEAVGASLGRPQDRRLTGRDGEMVLNASYLVEDEHAERFRDLVAEVAARAADDALELELTGPWPAYHFVREVQPA
jgi:hypothetical protein